MTMGQIADDLVSIVAHLEHMVPLQIEGLIEIVEKRHGPDAADAVRKLIGHLAND